MRTTIHVPARGIRFTAPTRAVAARILFQNKWIGPVQEIRAGLYQAWPHESTTITMIQDQDPGDES